VTKIYAQIPRLRELIAERLRDRAVACAGHTVNG
jgi:hypothetical protein